MRKAFLFLFLLLSVFAGSFTLSRFFEQKRQKGGEKGPSIFEPASFSLKNRPFTIVIVGYNNGAYVEKTLSSIFSQTYEHFRLVYIDDGSDDGSFEMAKDCIYESDHTAHVTLVRNEERLGVLANVYRAVIACPDDEIIVLLKSEDWLAHEWVLQRLNAYYDDPHLWISFAQGIDYPSYKFPIIPNIKDVRHQEEVKSHLKCFYASLFKQVRESDFIYAGTFLPACAEFAYMTPMIEMAGDHLHFIPEVLCVHNREVLQKEDRELIQRCEKYIRSLDPYSPLTTLQVIPCGD